MPDARDGWEYALDSFADPAPFLARLRRLGEITGRMHALLASDHGDAAFRPEELGERSDDDALTTQCKHASLNSTIPNMKPEASSGPSARAALSNITTIMTM